MPALPRPPDRHPRALKERMLLAIADHIRVHGRTNWSLVREHPAFADLIGKASGEAGRRKFFRYVAAVSSPPAKDATRPHETNSAAEAAFDDAKVLAREAGKHLPAPPSPAYLMRTGATGLRNIDFMAEVHVIYADAVRLRTEAMEPDEDAPEGLRIKDQNILQRSIKGRLDVINTLVRIMHEVYDLDHQQRFQEAVYDILVSELAGVPEIRLRVLNKLKQLNDREGLTLHAEAQS